MADVLMVIAPKDFRDEEYFYVREELEKGGHKVDVASLEDTAVSMIEKKEVVTDLLLNQCDVADYDSLIFVGGQGANVYFDNEKAREMAFQTYEQGKIIAAICIAPSILARAGILEGKRTTCWSSQKEDLEEHGAIVTESHVEIDGNIITGNGPEASREFGMKISSALGGVKEEPKEEKKEVEEETVEVKKEEPVSESVVEEYKRGELVSENTEEKTNEEPN